ncbi:YslB family protein [Alkalibacterium iburiense]|uniref:YslB family protein n=1 Tax=Alkalibacterium iburiense TaxID=290589 RepID=A0ABN0X2E9_9LACT
MEQEATPHVQGITLLRDQLLPKLLKEDEESILYWAGKELARSYDFSSVEDILQTMEEVSFGTVEMVEKKRSSYRFHLFGSVVTSRLNGNKNATFDLETGFLAQAVQQVSQVYSEGTYRLIKKGSRIEILIQTDRKESLTE